LPVGNAGNITAYWRGFRRYADTGRTPDAGLPRMLGFQAEGAAPIVRNEPVESPETVADAEILDTQLMVVRLEGVFCEPASAAGVAGVQRLAAERRIGRQEVVVCVLTGHGLKDPDAVQSEEGSLIPIPADLDSIRSAMGL
ncbi:MAG: pyridoxal-phosphate dependent enzyme, partial [Actinomycetota bacterium]|nr:pyridoxal-phosphate dependent enzyme [Actinomycetota bacterium]